MDQSLIAAAQAISAHRFPDSYPYLADEVVWLVMGGDSINGRQAVVDACEESAAHLATVRTEFTRFTTVVGEGTVVVETTAEYADPDGTVVLVASCDAYDVEHDKISQIRSYNAELD